jgi:hypothetical protein
MALLDAYGFNPDGYLDPADLAGYQDWFAAKGLVRWTPPAAREDKTVAR